MTHLYLRGFLVLTLGLNPQEVKERSSEILLKLALAAHTVILIEKDDQNNLRIENVTNLEKGSVIRTVKLDGVKESNMTTG